MRFFLTFLCILVVAAKGYAQYTYTIKADSVKITSAADSGELIIQNHTQGVQGGFLYNTGNGRTIFKKVLQKVNDSLYLVGVDSLKTLSPDTLNAATGFNVEFLYGNGNSGIPVKGGDSSYTNVGLIGKRLIVYFNGPYSSSIIQDSITWGLLGSHRNIPYFKYADSLGKVVFCNMQNVDGLVNGQFVVSIFGGPQGGYPNVVNTGSPIPTLTVSPSSLSGFSALAGTASVYQSFAVSGTNLLGNTLVTAPSNYQVSLSATSGYGSTVSLSETGGSLGSTAVYTEIAGSASVGSPSGNISVTSTGAATQYVSVSGTVTAPTTDEVVVLKGTVTNTAMLTLNLAPYVGTYDAFKIFLYNVVPANTGSSLYCQVSTDGSTFDAASGDYNWRTWTTSQTNNQNGDAGIDLMDDLSIATPGQSAASVIEIEGLNSPAIYPAIHSITTGIRNFQQHLDIYKAQGYRLNAQVTKGIRFYMGVGNTGASNGNIANMAYKVIGIKN